MCSVAEIKHVDEVWREEVGHRCMLQHFRRVALDAESDFPLNKLSIVIVPILLHLFIFRNHHLLLFFLR